MMAQSGIYILDFLSNFLVLSIICLPFLKTTNSKQLYYQRQIFLLLFLMTTINMWLEMGLTPGVVVVVEVEEVAEVEEVGIEQRSA